MDSKKWHILNTIHDENIIDVLLENRHITSVKDKKIFLHPPDPQTLTTDEVGIDPEQLEKAVERITLAIINHESIIVYADYDADGITAGAIMWDTIYHLGGNVMPYIPHRVDEGYGLSKKGIDSIIKDNHPTLVITVDHGITAKDKVEYAKSLGVDVIVTDHHVKPAEVPNCTTVHTTAMSGSGISWFVSNALYHCRKWDKKIFEDDMVSFATIGTIADMIPLNGINRTLVKYGLSCLNRSERTGLIALIQESGLEEGNIGTYDISHVLAPRLNAMGRLVHAMDALRLLCTTNKNRAEELATTLGMTNKERQQLTTDSTIHAKEIVGTIEERKIIFISHASYNQGVIGLVAGKLVEEYYRPSIVIAEGEEISKGSARSIPGFNIIDALRAHSSLLIDAGGHPMAAGFTIMTENLVKLKEALEKYADIQLSNDNFVRELQIDAEIPISYITKDVWKEIQNLEPFGFGNTEPVFVTRQLKVVDTRLVGNLGKHLKLKVEGESSHTKSNKVVFDGIAFNMGYLLPKLKNAKSIDIVYTIDMNIWNGQENLQLKVKDIDISS